MGLIDKFKNMFTEEVDEDDVVVEKTEQPKQPVKKEVELPKKSVTPEIKVTPIVQTETKIEKEEIPIISEKINIEKQIDEKPFLKHEEKSVSNEEESKPFLKREDKFVFPVYFDDNDFKKIEKSSSEKIVKEEKQPERKEIYGAKIERKEEPRVFKPTPIISPIYGVLDKNYHKDDISAKKVVHTEYHDPSKPLTIDEVRKKAYGNLEDDIETSLLAKSSIFMEPDKNVDVEEETKNNLLSDLVDDANEESEYSSVDEFLNSSIEDYEAKHKTDFENDFDLENDSIDSILNNEIDNSTFDDEDLTSKNNKKKKSKTSRGQKSSLDELLNSDDYGDSLLDDYMNNSIENEETKDEDDEDLTQSDLFNLIDSMYEKGEEE